MASVPTAPHALRVLWIAIAAVMLVAPAPGRALAQGLLEAISGNQEVVYSLVSTKTTDQSGTTTKFESDNLNSRTNVRLNYSLLPTLSINAGGSYEKSLSEVSGDTGSGETTITRVRPYLWLNFRDPVFRAAVGYERSDETVESAGQETTLTRDTYNGMLEWRPQDLPVTQFRYGHTATHDDNRAAVDTSQDLFFLKSEYDYRGLNVYYAGTYLASSDMLREVDTRQTTHEGKLLYATTFLDGRIALTTDNRITLTNVETEAGAADFSGLGLGLDSGLALQLPARRGLFVVNDDAINAVLAENALLIDNDVTATAAAALNVGFQGGIVTRRQVALDFGTAVAVNALRVWVTGFDGTLPDDIVNAFSWDVYTSTNGTTWTLHAAVGVARFGPFDRRFEMTFPVVTTQFIKVVTRPLSTAVTGGTQSPTTISITELQAFVDRTAELQAGGGRKFSVTQTTRTHTIDVRTVLFRSPSIYHRFNADYQVSDPDGQERYNVSNGLFLTQPLSRVFSLSANASYEFGRDRDETRNAVLYYAALNATPLPTLTDSLVFSGNRQWTGSTTSAGDALVLYNTAQLYRGIDATLNLGVSFTSETEDDSTTRRREYFVNVGTGFTPHPSLTLSTFYLGRLSETSTGTTGEDRTTTAHQLDLGLSFSPFRTLSVTAGATISAESDRETTSTQTYGVNWAPFPDGTLQFSFFYGETLLSDGTKSRLIQPTLRWYLTQRRRSYLEAAYQVNTTDSPLSKSESKVFSTGLNVAF
jgi:hypothetical protein